MDPEKEARNYYYFAFTSICSAPCPSASTLFPLVPGSHREQETESCIG